MTLKDEINKSAPATLQSELEVIIAKTPANDDKTGWDETLLEMKALIRGTPMVINLPIFSEWVEKHKGRITAMAKQSGADV